MSLPTAPDPAGAGSRQPMAVWPVALAVGIRLAVWLLVPATRFASDEESYFRAGTMWLTAGEQDVFWPPVTGWIIGTAGWILGTTSVSALRLAWIALDVGCVLAVGALAGRVAPVFSGGDARREARFVTLATVGYALYLPAISFAQFTTSETPALLLMLLALVLLTRPHAGPGAFLGAGIVTGALVLTRQSLLPLLVLLPAATLWPTPSAARLRPALACVLAGGIVVGAGALRGWHLTGELTIAQNSAYNLYIGNRELYAEDLNLFSPRATADQIAFRREFWNGELAYPDASPAALRREAFEWITANPGTFARRALGRLARVFVPRTDVLELVGGERQAGIFSPGALALLVAANAQWTLVLAGGVLGLAALPRRHPRLGALFASAIVGSLLLCLVAISKPRYSFVFDPLLLVGAVAFFTAPRDGLSRLGTVDRWLVTAVFGFLAWGWLAWLIFAMTSRLALAGPA